MRRFNDFDPEVQARLENCLSGVRASLEMTIPIDEIDEVIDLVAEYLVTAVQSGMGVDEVDVIAQSVEDDTVSSVHLSDTCEVVRPRVLETRVGGVPVGLVDPASTLASRWWDPRSPKVFVPRLLGIGWDLNFGAIAVKLGLIQPDSEDEPFALVPQKSHAFGALIPLLVAAINAFVLLVFAPRLPASVPVHFGPTGLPDRWGGFWEAFAIPLVITILPAAYAAATVILRRSAIGRAVTVAFALMLGSVGLGITFTTLLAVSPASFYSRFTLFGSLLVALVAPLAYLTCLSRIGMRKEIEKSRNRERGVPHV